MEQGGTHRQAVIWFLHQIQKLGRTVRNFKLTWWTLSLWENTDYYKLGCSGFSLKKQCCKLKQRDNLIKCSGIQANHKTCRDENTERNCFFSSIMPLFLIRETKAGNQNVRLFHPRRVPMDTEKEESALILVKIIIIPSEWKIGRAISGTQTAHAWTQSSGKTL